MDTWIIASKRTPVAPRDGALAAFEPWELAVPVIRACVDEAGLALSDVDELIAGNALGAGGNPARIAALGAGLRDHVPGISIDRQCCGGLDALLLADALIRAGRAQVVIAGGMESYSRHPLRYRTFIDGAAPVAYDQPPFSPWPDRDPDMADAADTLAEMYGVERNEQDAWAVASHAKALAARADHGNEIVPLGGLDHDAFARDLTLRLCARAKVVSGTITAANTSVAADGAAFCVVVSDEVARRLNNRRVRISGGKTLGGNPEHPGIAPVRAIREVLKDADLRAGDLVAAEIMEAYAVQAIACVKEARIAPEITNLGGGSLSRGHPIGASGAILAVRLHHELRHRRGTGLAAIAAAGGLGTALLLEAVNQP